MEYIVFILKAAHNSTRCFQSYAPPVKMFLGNEDKCKLCELYSHQQPMTRKMQVDFNAARHNTMHTNSVSSAVHYSAVEYSAIKYSANTTLQQKTTLQIQYNVLFHEQCTCTNSKNLFLQLPLFIHV